MNAYKTRAPGSALRVALAAVAMAAALLTPMAAMADGTGDDPACPPDSLSPAQLFIRSFLERYQDSEWKATGYHPDDMTLSAQDADLGIAPEDGTTADLAGASPAGGVSAAGMIIPPGIPYRYIWTPTHAQERSYWCGPATVQVIDDHFGAHASQATIANWLGTTTAGTAFTKVDDALRYFAGKLYYYYGGLTEKALWLRVQHSLLDHGQPLAADVRIKGSVWPNYVYDHAGHIVPVEGFDWRYSKIRLNDVYAEDKSRSGGGATLGHRTYPRYVFWDGINRHPQKAVVAAP